MNRLHPITENPRPPLIPSGTGSYHSGADSLWERDHINANVPVPLTAGQGYVLRIAHQLFADGLLLCSDAVFLVEPLLSPVAAGLYGSLRSPRFAIRAKVTGSLKDADSLRERGCASTRTRTRTLRWLTQSLRSCRNWIFPNVSKKVPDAIAPGDFVEAFFKLKFALFWEQFEPEFKTLSRQKLPQQKEQNYD